MWSYNYNFGNSDELYHHGVLGMKWGKRKAQSTGIGGRLGRAAVAAVKTAANPQINKDGPQNKPSALDNIKRAGGVRKANKDGWKAVKKELSTKEGKQAAKTAAKKTALKVGAAAAGAALTAYGTYKVSEFVLNKQVKPFSVEQLKSMGISTFEPDRIQINRFKV